MRSGVFPLLEIEAGPDPSLVPQWRNHVSFVHLTPGGPTVDSTICAMEQPNARSSPSSPPCTVVAVPTHGFGNRMRMLSCAHAYAAHHGCALQALWRTTLHMPTPWAELFATPLAQPDPSMVVRHGDRQYTVASLAASFARLPVDDPDSCEPGPPAGHTDRWLDSSELC